MLQKDSSIIKSILFVDIVQSKMSFRVSAQFEPLAAVYIALSDFDSVQPEKLEKWTNKTTLSSCHAGVIRGLEPFVRPVVVAKDEQQLTDFMKQEGFTSLYHYIIPHDDIWIRDSGVEWIVNDEEQIMLDHHFGLWGYINTKISGDWISYDNPSNIPAQLSKYLNQPLVQFPEWYKGEGGNRSFNGKGTLIANITCEMQRNPGKTLGEIESCLMTMFHIKKIIWLPIGVSDDDLSFLGPKYYENGIPCYTMVGTGGHVDEFCRFIDQNTVILAGLGDIEKYHYKPGFMVMESENRMALIYNMIKNETDQDGNKLNIIRIPFPEIDPILMDKGDETYQCLLQLYDSLPDKVYGLPASSYGNFLIANDAVIVSQYSQGNDCTKLKHTDKMVIDVFEQHFKKVIGINNLAMNCGGGGLNCTSNDQPLQGLSELPGILFKLE
jgi:agmatine deiminase